MNIIEYSKDKITLENIKEKLLIQDPSMIGEIWQNEKIEILFNDVKCTHFNIALMQWVYDLLKDIENKRWYDCKLTKGQFTKLNSICKAKNNAVRLKRCLSFISLLSKGFYSYRLNKTTIDSWIKFMDVHVKELH